MLIIQAHTGKWAVCFIRRCTFISMCAPGRLWLGADTNAAAVNAVYIHSVNVVISFNLCLHIINYASVTYITQVQTAFKCHMHKHKHIIIYREGRVLHWHHCNEVQYKVFAFLLTSVCPNPITRHFLLKKRSTKHHNIIDSHLVSRCLKCRLFVALAFCKNELILPFYNRLYNGL